jgi:hypothetical protein
MKDVLYDQQQKKWLVLSESNTYTLGRTTDSLTTCPSLPLSSELPTFRLCINKRNLGPVIGILTVQKDDHTLAGNRSLFMKIQQFLLRKGGISIVFTPEGLNRKNPIGYLYWPTKQKWIKVPSPIPHVVYNRIPTREAEQTSNVHDVLVKLRNDHIPYFNPHFLDKSLLYTCLSASSFLKEFLPATILITSKEAFHSFLEDSQHVYLKPSFSSQGRGIYRIDFTNNQIQLIGIDKTYIYPSLDEFWLHWSNRLMSQRYIAQVEILTTKINGHRFDFRILAHATGKRQDYRVTGVGIRQSSQQEITTHIVSGGTIIPYDSIRTNNHDQFIKKVVQNCGEILTEEFGFFGEFSIDAAQTEQGKYYIFEINSKPMSFDEADIENKRMDYLSQLFFQLSGFEL